MRSEELLARVNALRPLIEAHADEAEQAAGYPHEVVRAIAAAGLSKLLVPEEYGGAEAELPLAARVFAAVAEIDGAAGWTVMIGAGGGPFAAPIGYIDGTRPRPCSRRAPAAGIRTDRPRIRRVLGRSRRGRRPLARQRTSRAPHRPRDGQSAMVRRPAGP